jgi:hypothetical protein
MNTRKAYRFEDNHILWIDDNYFKIKKPNNATFVFRCCLSKYKEIIKKYFCRPRHFDFDASLVLREIMHQNLDHLIWENQEELPAIHKNPRYLKADIPYSYKEVEATDSYAFYHSFCGLRTLKKYLQILEEINFLKVGRAKKGYVTIYDIDLAKWVEVMKTYYEDIENDKFL